ncbi:dephospho-CoA kinase [Cupriavidus basilensis]
MADLFAARGAALIDTDLLAHEITAPGGLAIPALLEAFGPTCLRDDGAMDRNAMRAAGVLADPAAKARLERHYPSPDPPADRSARAASAPPELHPYLIYVVPLLVESGLMARAGGPGPGG